MTAFSERVRMAREHAGLSLSKFGERLGVSKSVIANLEYDKVSPTEPIIRAIAHEFGIDYDWLKFGTGEMFGTDEDAVLAELDDLMTGEEHPEIRAIIRAMAGMTSDEMDAIEVLIARIKKELG